MDRRADGRGHIHAEMRRHRHAIVDALAAEHAAFDAGRRPVEAGEKIRRPDVSR